VTVEIPDELRGWVPQVFGERGVRWLADLPDLARALAARWELRLGRPYLGGTHALVLAVDRPDGSPAVLKIPVVDDENYAEADALLAYDGDGAVLLYDRDRDSGALLLERSEPGTALLEHPDRERALTIAYGLSCRLRRPPPAGVRFPAARDLAARWAVDLPQRQRRHRLPGADRRVARAAEVARRYADAPQGPELLINRDLHLGNVLRAERRPWLLIDPKPLVGEAAFEGGFPVLKLLFDGWPGDRAVDRVAAGLGVDAARVRGWAFLRALADALWLAGIDDDPGDYLTMAEALDPGGHA
jgi:streptomycin 6-kinase